MPKRTPIMAALHHALELSPGAETYQISLIAEWRAFMATHGLTTYAELIDAIQAGKSGHPHGATVSIPHERDLMVSEEAWLERFETWRIKSEASRQLIAAVTDAMRRGEERRAARAAGWQCAAPGCTVIIGRPMREVSERVKIPRMRDAPPKTGGHAAKARPVYVETWLPVRKDARTCSTRCRTRLWRSREAERARERLRRNGWPCEHCGETIPGMTGDRPTRQDKRLCSTRCRTLAYRARKAVHDDPA